MRHFFTNRETAGIKLSEKLEAYSGKANTVVLGIPRGGVPVASVIAKELKLPLDIILSKKIGHPFNPEFAIGAVTENLVMVDNGVQVDESYFKDQVEKIRKQIAERNQLFRGKSDPLELKNKSVIIIDDGIATGNTLLITIEMLRKQGVKKVIVASPVVPADRVKIIENACDEFIYLYAPVEFNGVGAFYEDFAQVSDEDVVRILATQKIK